MNKNILISMRLFNDILDMLNSLEPIVPDHIRTEFIHLVWDMNLKKHKLELRDAYSRIVTAKNTDDRDWARIEYLQLKNNPII